jgi:hypothetical protein
VSWELIRQLLGPGLHWGRTQAELRAAIAEAERLGEADAAEHLRIILRLRNDVCMEREEKTPAAQERESCGGQNPGASRGDKPAPGATAS